MLLKIFSRSVRRILAVAACTGAAVFGANHVIAQPGGGGGSGGGGPTCTISSPQNDPVSVTAGGSVNFRGVVSDGTAPYSVTWTFQGGSPSAANEVLQNSGDQTQQYNVSYANAGTFTTTMSATDSNNKKAKTCSATRTVNVGGGDNFRPVAQNDDYNTTENTTLNVAAPGVLGNDNDPEGDPMSAALVTDVSNGSLSLASNGGFSYTPNNGFTGSDSFTYTANDAGGPGNEATVSIGVAGANEVSINSTSDNGTPGTPVSEQPDVSNSSYTLVAINDLGMHCGDLDTRISSILPPFNVLHAQVVERGVSGLPRVMGEGEVELYYSAASNPDDPAIGKVAGGLALSSVVNGNVFKTNFWDIAFGAYDPFYPDNILELFYDPNNPDANVDIGLPVPDVERFYLEDGELHATQQAMPGLSNPYVANVPQQFQEHFNSFPFFTGFPFGYIADGVNWFEAAGVPIAAFDDFGRENPYPLMQVEAHMAGTPIASLDTVVPISGEAECQFCHGAPADGGTGVATASLGTVTASIDDPAHGDVPNEVSIEWASDLNLLRLHDQKHGTTLESAIDPVTGQAAEPVVCQRCHYTPALDLAQLGPLGPENDFAADFVNSDVPGGIISSPSVANGRDQVKHKSMSNVMHSHHGTVDASGLSPGDPGYDANNLLIPSMPPAINAQGERRSPTTTQTILEESCYLCHPGKRTQCMRGAMAKGGLVCQDCHGQMQDVGDDFTRTVSPSSPGTFELAGDFYDNPATPRVPWANEPGCGSCHTGYATDNLAGDPNVLVNPFDTLGNADDIRLLAAYRTDDPKATPIVPTNKAFAENVVAEGGAADGNPKLYRVSTGHGGLFCQSCHGSTHAEWPSTNPTANDNTMAEQLQGHQGYIAECQVCHEPTDESLPLGNNGPHGMHAVSDLQFSNPAFLPDDRWNLQHRSYRNQGPGCESCHGPDLRGTVLSRTAEDRTVRCKDNKGSLPGCAAGNPTAIIPKGTPVGCGLCHRQK
ncbi:MAG: Ig-like domain-containing protein [Chromatiales bacterium]|jgi:VCBS repeat-containing protein